MEAACDLNADELYELHWQLKRLGQRTCTHAYANCRSCALSSLCLQRVEAARAA